MAAVTLLIAAGVVAEVVVVVVVDPGFLSRERLVRRVSEIQPGVIRYYSSTRTSDAARHDGYEQGILA